MTKSHRYTEDEIEMMLVDQGLRRVVDGERHSFLSRWKCRILGPHDWTPLMRYIPETGAFIEEGMICDRCHKER